MAHYSIYVPGARGASDDHLRRVGLEGLAERGGTQWTEVIGRGPDGGIGSIATWTPTNNPEHDPLLGYYPDRQEWRPAEADAERGLEEGRYWFGFEPDRPPSPADLAYQQQIFGARVQLADGQAWIVPFASRLPHRHKLTSGKWGRVVKEQYRDFFERCQRNAEVIFTVLDLQDFMVGRRAVAEASDELVKITIDDGARLCCDALAINYRLTPEIIDMLGLLDDRSMIAIIWTTIEMQDIVDVRDQKKTAEEFVTIPVGSSISSGE